MASTILSLVTDHINFLEHSKQAQAADQVKRTLIHTHTYTQIHTHTHIQTYTHMHIAVSPQNTDTHTHTHTHIPLGVMVGVMLIVSIVYSRMIPSTEILCFT